MLYLSRSIVFMLEVNPALFDLLLSSLRTLFVYFETMYTSGNLLINDKLLEFIYKCILSFLFTKNYVVCCSMEFMI